MISGFLTANPGTQASFRSTKGSLFVRSGAVINGLKQRSPSKWRNLNAVLIGEITHGLATSAIADILVIKQKSVVRHPGNRRVTVFNRHCEIGRPTKLPIRYSRRRLTLTMDFLLRCTCCDRFFYSNVIPVATNQPSPGLL